MPRFIRARNICLAAAATAAGLGVFVSTSAGSSSSRTATHRAATYRTVRSRSISGAYVYPGSTIVNLAGGHSASGTVKCPASAPHPVSGQFLANSTLVVATSSFRNKNGWYTRLTNLGKTTAKTQIGTVCAP